MKQIQNFTIWNIFHCCVALLEVKCKKIKIVHEFPNNIYWI